MGWSAHFLSPRKLGNQMLNATIWGSGLRAMKLSKRSSWLVSTVTVWCIHLSLGAGLQEAWWWAFLLPWLCWDAWPNSVFRVLTPAVHSPVESSYSFQLSTMQSVLNQVSQLQPHPSFASWKRHPKYCGWSLGCTQPFWTPTQGFFRVADGIHHV